MAQAQQTISIKDSTLLEGHHTDNPAVIRTFPGNILNLTKLSATFVERPDVDTVVSMLSPAVQAYVKIAKLLPFLNWGDGALTICAVIPETPNACHIGYWCGMMTSYDIEIQVTYEVPDVSTITNK